MPGATTIANTRAIGLQIANFLQSLTYADGSEVYTQASLEEIKDVTDKVTGGGVCVEVYGNIDTSERRGFGGRVWDTQTWFILSLCSLDTSDKAQRIYDVRDQLTFIFQQHATLGTQVFNLFHSQLKDSMRFLRVERNGIFLRAHLAELLTKQEVYIPGGIIS